MTKHFYPDLGEFLYRQFGTSAILLKAGFDDPKLFPYDDSLIAIIGRPQWISINHEASITQSSYLATIEITNSRITEAIQFLQALATIGQSVYCRPDLQYRDQHHLNVIPLRLAPGSSC